MSLEYVGVKLKTLLALLNGSEARAIIEQATPSRPERAALEAKIHQIVAAGGKLHPQELADEFHYRAAHVWQVINDMGYADKLARQRSKEPISQTHPELAAEWDQEKNAELTPDQVTYGANKRVWWKCPKGHESYQATPNVRTGVNKQGCPKCGGRLGTSLAQSHPELAAEFDLQLNAPLTPDQVPTGSTKRVWWRCSRDSNHVWDSTVGNRTTNKRGCPHCYRQWRRKLPLPKRTDPRGKGGGRDNPRRSSRGGSTYDIGPVPPNESILALLNGATARSLVEERDPEHEATMRKELEQLVDGAHLFNFDHFDAEIRRIAATHGYNDISGYPTWLYVHAPNGFPTLHGMTSTGYTIILDFKVSDYHPPPTHHARHEYVIRARVAYNDDPAHPNTRHFIFHRASSRDMPTDPRPQQRTP